ncbi:MAG TPA: response regulator, partial [Acidimicrobiia bacterium]|nr:response regulator [Acidimicrobiia bacterium]
GTVLVVEDERGVRTAARRILERAGYRVIEATSGAEALDDHERAHADLLLTDVVMPGGVSGRDLAEVMTARDPNLRVVYMSGYTRDVIAHQGILEDGVHLVEKPFTAGALLDAIGAALDGAPAAVRS